MSIPVETVLSLLQAHPYLLLFPLIAVEGPLTTICAGILAATGLIAWPVAFGMAVAADLTGDTFYYLLGRSARRPRVAGLLARIGLTQERLATVEASFERNGARALVGAKVADFAAIPVFVAAGLTNLGYGRFLAWTAAATVPKSGLLVLLGYFAGGQALALAERLSPGPILSLALLALVPVAYLWITREFLFRRTKRKQTHSRGERR